MRTRNNTSRGGAPVTLNGGENNAPACENSTPSTPKPAVPPVAPGTPEGAPSAPTQSIGSRQVPAMTWEEESEWEYLESLDAARTATTPDSE